MPVANGINAHCEVYKLQATVRLPDHIRVDCNLSNSFRHTKEFDFSEFSRRATFEPYSRILSVKFVIKIICRASKQQVWFLSKYRNGSGTFIVF